MEVLPAIQGGDWHTVKSVKRKKSLSRSLSAAFRKPSKSHPQEEQLVPQIPKELRANTAPNSPRQLSPDVRSGSGERQDQIDVIRAQIEFELLGRQIGGQDVKIKKRRSLRHLSLRQAKQESWAKGDDSQRPRTASESSPNVGRSGAKEDFEKPKRVKSKKGLRITTKPSNEHRSFTTSTFTTPKDSPVLPQLSRPATSGPSPISPKLGEAGRNRANSSPRNGLPKVSPSTFNLPPSPQRPWQPSYNSSEIRSSFRSAVTTATTITTGTGTSRSSIVTKDTAITDVTNDNPTRPTSKDENDGGMTVDEAIDMYAAGFTDDPEVQTQGSRDTSLSDEERRRSAKIAEAIQDNMSSPASERPSFSARPSTSGSSRSRFWRSNSAAQSSPALSVDRGSTRDQYGFLKSNHYINRAAYDTWYAEYHMPEARRTEKWAEFMQEHKLPTVDPIKFPQRSAKTQRYVRKGIPPAWRGAAWFFYAGGESYLARHPQLYNNLTHLTDSRLPDSEKEAIERDLHRTFPDNVQFKPDPASSPVRETPILASLRNVLRAFALHNPKIGYCQSLNFIAGLLLLFLPEEKTFWMLHIITFVYLPATHEVSLEGANVDLWVLAIALKNTMPGVWAKVGGADMTGEDGKSSRLPPISLCATSWFMSLFIGTLPIETVLRVWDVLFYEGSRTLFRVALNIFKIGEQKIKAVNDPMEMFQIVQGLPRGMIDAGKFMELVCKKGQVGADWVERMRGERRITLAKQRAKNPKATEDEDVEAEEVGASHLRRKKSVWGKLRRDGML